MTEQTNQRHESRNQDKAHGDVEEDLLVCPGGIVARSSECFIRQRIEQSVKGSTRGLQLCPNNRSVAARRLHAAVCTLDTSGCQYRSVSSPAPASRARRSLRRNYCPARLDAPPFNASLPVPF